MEEFIKSWNQDKNDILILDIHRHVMSGCNLLENLENRNLHLPVIIVTAYDEQPSRNCALRYETLGYLLKPVDSEALLGVIKQVSKS